MAKRNEKIIYNKDGFIRVTALLHEKQKEMLFKLIEDENRTMSNMLAHLIEKEYKRRFQDFEER